jgi:hypothetical protein
MKLRIGRGMYRSCSLFTFGDDEEEDEPFLIERERDDRVVGNKIGAIIIATRPSVEFYQHAQPQKYNGFG